MKEKLTSIYNRFRPSTWIITLVATAMIREANLVFYLMGYGTEMPQWQQTTHLVLNFPFTIALVAITLICLNQADKEESRK